MLWNTLLMVIDAVGGFLTILLLVRFYMQLAQVGFRNQLGHFVMQATDWLVLPLRRVVPALRGLDLASLLPALLLQTLIVLLTLWIRGATLRAEFYQLLPVLVGFGLLELMKLSVYLLIGAVLISAVLSWVNPFSPLRGLLDIFTAPFLAPLRRRIPMIANIDLSPLVLLLFLQVVLGLIAHVHSVLLPYLV